MLDNKFLVSLIVTIDALKSLGFDTREAFDIAMKDYISMMPERAQALRGKSAMEPRP